jgi:hypothetical protein
MLSNTTLCSLFVYLYFIIRSTENRSSQCDTTLLDMYKS